MLNIKENFENIVDKIGYLQMLKTFVIQKLIYFRIG